MKYNFVIVLGSDSSIANFAIPKLGIDDDRFLAVSRSGKVPNWARHYLKLNSNDEDLLISSVNNVCNLKQSPVAILNFSGFFGKVDSFERAHIKDILEASSNNLELFLLGAKLLSAATSGSILVSFCGGGVGGGNLDDSSLGYLSAKASLPVVNEAINNQLSSSKLYSTLISPGAFPSKMQSIVAQSSVLDVPAARIKAAADVKLDEALLNKLVEMIWWVLEHPTESGGRLFSAAYDLPLPETLDKDFGKLRRVFN